MLLSAALVGLLALPELLSIHSAAQGQARPAALLGRPQAAPLARDGFERADAASRARHRSHSDRPWRARKRTGVVALPEGSRRPERPTHALTQRRLRALGVRAGERLQIPIEAWPEEPHSPALIDRARFEAAFAALCPPSVPSERVRRFAHAALSAGAEYGVDPFMLAALASHQSGCQARTEDSWGIGLARVNPGMHRARVRAGVYRYRRPGPNGLENATLRLGRHPLDRHALLDPAHNLTLTAAVLRVFQEQCPYIDEPFGSHPHRHPVSHLVYGDEVRSAVPEALILIERRRLLGYYRAGEPEPPLSVLRGVPMSCPLDGAPRLVTGLIGDPRDSGRRTHYGIDLPAQVGEPVRAVADGVVVFAGAEVRGRGELAFMPDRVVELPVERLGPRGVFVRLSHPGGLTSLYVHLADYKVQTGQLVRRGDVLGTVGLTGVHSSDAHLHFGLFDGEVPVDPMRHIGPYLRVNRDAVPGLEVWRAPLQRLPRPISAVPTL